MDVRIVSAPGEKPTLADELAAFLARKRTAPHVHACTECFQDAPCGLGCETSHTTTEEDERRGVLRGDACACGLCLHAAGLPGDMFCTSIADHVAAARAAVRVAGACESATVSDPVSPCGEGGEES